MDKITEKLAKLDGYKWDDATTFIKNQIPKYLSDFNAIYNLEEKLGLHDRENSAIRVKWVGNLHSIVAKRCPVNKVGSPLVSDVDKMFATCEERAGAIFKSFS